jgi:hypothetical protein
MIHSAVHPSSRQRKFVAWLGIFAICLAVFMPLVSQWIDAPAQADTMLCSADGGMQTAPGDDGPPQPHPAHGPDFCGYCNLLTHTPFAVAWGGALAVSLAPAVAIHLAADAPLPTGRRYRRALPRAPPNA